MKPYFTGLSAMSGRAYSQEAFVDNMGTWQDRQRWQQRQTARFDVKRPPPIGVVKHPHGVRTRQAPGQLYNMA